MDLRSSLKFEFQFTKEIIKKTIIGDNIKKEEINNIVKVGIIGEEEIKDSIGKIEMTKSIGKKEITDRIDSIVKNLFMLINKQAKNHKTKNYLNKG